MAKKNTDDLDLGFELLEGEINEEREDYDLRDRLTKRPKRKPEVVTIYLDEEAAEELGYAVDEVNEFGTPTGKRIRVGVVGEIDAIRERWNAELESDEPDEKAVKQFKAEANRLSKRAAELKKIIEKDSLTLTLQWFPPMIEKIIRVKAKRAIGVKQGKIPNEKMDEFEIAWLARALEASVVKFVDNSNGFTKENITLGEVVSLQRLAPKDQFPKFDMALGRLLNRKLISEEVLDNPDF